MARCHNENKNLVELSYRDLTVISWGNLNNRGSSYIPSCGI